MREVPHLNPLPEGEEDAQRQVRVPQTASRSVYEWLLGHSFQKLLEDKCLIVLLVARAIDQSNCSFFNFAF